MKTFITKKLGVSIAATALLLGAMGSAQATLVLRLTNGGSQTTILDGGVGDNLPGLAGIISFTGTVGVFDINVTTGSSKPLDGSASHPEMLLGSRSQTFTVGGVLRIELSDVDFIGTGVTKFTTNVNGTANQGTVSHDTFVDSANISLGTTVPPPPISLTATPVGGIPPTAGAPFDLTSNGQAILPGLYSMTLVTTIVHTGAGTTFYDARTTAVPEPASLAIMGLGLLGLCGVNLRRRGETRA